VVAVQGDGAVDGGFVVHADLAVEESGPPALRLPVLLLQLGGQQQGRRLLLRRLLRLQPRRQLLRLLQGPGPGSLRRGQGLGNMHEHRAELHFLLLLMHFPHGRGGGGSSSHFLRVTSVVLLDHLSEKQTHLFLRAVEGLQ
jgi:hypothetical protein